MGNNRTVSQIEEHIRLLSIFHYVVGGLIALIGCFPIIHLVMGIFFLTTDFPATLEVPEGVGVENMPSPEFPNKIFGAMFIVVPSLVILGFWTVAAFIIYAGRKLAAHQSHTLCLAAAGIACAIFPFGTVLGVFSLITLLKPEARELFGLPSIRT